MLQKGEKPKPVPVFIDFEKAVCYANYVGVSERTPVFSIKRHSPMQGECEKSECGVTIYIKEGRTMERKPVTIDLEVFPEEFHPLLDGAKVYDSSCSARARVYYIEKDAGFYLKRSPAGTLTREAALTEFFHSKGLGAEVLGYCSLEQDWLLTRKIPGEDCIWSRYLEDPKRLSQLTGELLRRLHEVDPTGCPVPDRTAEYLTAAERGYRENAYEADLFPDNWGYATPEAAWRDVETYGPYLKNDTLLHGDYCLPNILLDDWKFTGFIDLDTGGVGDRHVDLFWGAWTLRFNLKTDAWCNRFLDAYGRDRIEPEILRAIAAFELFG